MDESIAGGMWKQWRPAIVGCLVVIVLLLAGMMLVLFSFYRSPYYRGLAQCRVQIKQVGDALNRYAIKNDRYPVSLSDLVPSYLPAKALHCPSDDSSSENVSYDYARVRIEAPDSVILLTCEHHVLKSRFPGTILHYLKSGEVIVSPPPKSN